MIPATWYQYTIFSAPTSGSYPVGSVAISPPTGDLCGKFWCVLPFRHTAMFLNFISLLILSSDVKYDCSSFSKGGNAGSSPLVSLATSGGAGSVTQASLSATSFASSADCPATSAPAVKKFSALNKCKTNSCKACSQQLTA
ncbi:MAG: hypothetical protein WC401_09260, partial [Bacteroidales bacterium]